MNKIEIDGQVYYGNRVEVRNGQVVVDGKVSGKASGSGSRTTNIVGGNGVQVAVGDGIRQSMGPTSDRPPVKIVILEGTIESLHVEGDVRVNGDVGSVTASGDVHCEKVGGNVTATKDVKCGDVAGNVTAGRDVKRR